MNGQLCVRLVHALPGRLRLRLSQPPRDPGRLLGAIRAHEGFLGADYTQGTRSFLIHYETGHLTSEEIMLRVALACSIDRDDAPVLVATGEAGESMTDLAILAGILLAAAALLRLGARRPAQVQLERAASLGVLVAVLQHGWREAREQGHFDPELLSLGYLMTATVQGRPLRGAAITWAASFGRHLLSESNRAVEVRPMGAAPRPDGARPYLLRRAGLPGKRAPLLAMTQATLRSLGMMLGDGGGSLISDLRNVAQAHGEIVEGLGGMHRKGIPLIFQ